MFIFLLPIPTCLQSLHPLLFTKKDGPLLSISTVLLSKVFLLDRFPLGGAVGLSLPLIGASLGALAAVSLVAFRPFSASACSCAFLISSKRSSNCFLPRSRCSFSWASWLCSGVGVLVDEALGWLCCWVCRKVPTRAQVPTRLNP